MKQCNTSDSYKIFNSYKDYDAHALLLGGPLAPNLKGTITLKQLKDGVYIYLYITGIPALTSNYNAVEFHGLNICEFGNCTVGDLKNPFLSAGNHWNPTNAEHPNHAGDLPPILSNNGTAMMSVFTNRFYVKDSIGKSFILHEGVENFVAQPPISAGKRLACGTIKPLYNC